jgi:hypothetical protein
MNPRCLGAVRRVNHKAGGSIYLVDNKDGGMNFSQADVYCAELNYREDFIGYSFIRPRDEKAVGAAS